MIEWLKTKLLDFRKLAPESESRELHGPFEQYRYPTFIVGVPTGKKAPRRCTISAVDGAAKFVEIYPWATDEEVSNVIHAFEYALAPAIQVIPARQ